MSNEYLLIENKGEAPETAFTVLGASGKANLNIPGIIGRFGSGAPLGTCTLVRQGIMPTVFLGRTRMDFFTERLEVTDVRQETTTFRQIGVQYGGTSKRKELLGFTTQYGAYDWNQIPFAMREYVSNSIDAMLMQGVKVQDVWQSIRVEVVGEDEFRAKSGYTRVYVPLFGHGHKATVQKFFDQIHCWFLHAEEPHMLSPNTDTVIMPKFGRSMKRNDDGTPTNRAIIYRRGVFVREFSQAATASLYDYNFYDLPLNESRTVNDWDILKAAGDAIRVAKPEIIATVLKSVSEGKEVWESKVPDYSLQIQEGDNREEVVKNWKAAAKIIGGDNAVVVNRSADKTAEQVRRKGFNPILMSDTFDAAMRLMGLKSDVEVLTEDDRRERKFFPPNEALTNTLDRVWAVVVDNEMANGREKPDAQLFWEQMEAECEKFGYCDFKKGIFVHTDYATEENDALDLTVLEEVGHWCSGATDCSRDFQQWWMRLVHAMMKRKKK